MIMSRTFDRLKSRWGLAPILTISIGATIALLIAAITWLDINRERAFTHDQFEQRGLLLVSTLADVMADPLYFSDVDSLRDIARSVGGQPDLVYVRVFKPDGRLLVNEESSEYPAESKAEGIPADAMHSMATALTFIGDDLDVVGPIEAGPEVIGMVQFRYSGESLRAEIQKIVLRHVWHGLVLMAVGMALAYLIARYASRPLHNLVRATRQIGGGNLSSAIPVGGTSETAELGAALDEMRNQLRTLYWGLERQVAQRTQELERAHEDLQTHVVERQRIADQRAQLLEEVSASQRRLRALSGRLVDVQEMERRHLARELHDEIGQLLTGLKLSLESASRALSGSAPQSLTQAQSAVDDLIARARSLALDLRPAMLDDMGLVPALVWYLDRYTSQTTIQVAFSHDGLSGRLPAEIETAAYRIVQEALTNVARHAGIDEAEVALRPVNGSLEMMIRDAGSGFDPKVVVEATASTGLNGMRERAELLGGRLAVESFPGSGTTLTARLPLTTVGSRDTG